MLRKRIVLVIVIAAVVLLVLAGLTSMTRSRMSSVMSGRMRMASSAAPQFEQVGDRLEQASFEAGSRDAKRMVVAGEPTAEGAATPNMDLAALSSSVEPDRYLIKNATMIVEVQDAKEALQRLTAAIEGAGGYVGNLQESVNALGRRSVMVQIRVPADQFDKALQGMEPLGKIINRQVTTQDVTEEYVDTDSRSRNLKRTEERLLDHLNKSARLEDTLRLEQELTRVREQIERLDGHLRVLGNRVRLSTIQVTLQEAPQAEPIVPAATFSTAKVASESVRSLVAFSQRQWTKAIWVGVWSAVWLPPLLVAWLAYRLVRRRKAANPSV